MSDIALSSAVRASLLSLQGTTKLIETTQGRLSSGLKVAGPIDDPVAYFQSKALNDRSFDFTEKKDSIDQGVSTITAAIDGVDAVESIVRQMKGLANNMKSATGTEFTVLVDQFNDLRDQINYLTTDTTYQGTNLINGTGETLSVSFSELTSSKLDIVSVDVTNATGGLNLTGALAHTGNFLISNTAHTLTDYTVGGGGVFSGLAASTDVTFTWQGVSTTYTGGATTTVTIGNTTQTVTLAGTSSVTYTNGATVTVDIAAGTGNEPSTGFYIMGEGLDVYASFATQDAITQANAGNYIATGTWLADDRTFTTADNGLIISFGTGSVAVHLVTGDSFTLTQGDTFDLGLHSGLLSTQYVAGDFNAGLSGDRAIMSTTAGYTDAIASYGIRLTADFTAGAAPTSYIVGEGDAASVNTLLTALDSSLTTLRSEASKLGTNVALLSTRLDFTNSYVNTLEGGAAKLTLADLNEEGANLLALQVRQSLGISALSFAGQAEQSILGLFR